MQSISSLITSKTIYNITDLSKIVNKKTQTIRSWERKGIIDKPTNIGDNGWRKYTREDLANILENLTKYNWQRNVIKNKDQIEIIIKYLRKEIANLELEEDND